VNVRYETLDLTDHCNRFLAESGGKPGWFGQQGQDLRNFRPGEQVLANVTYHPVDYATAPVPNCLMLGANGAPDGLPPAVTGIKVGKSADVLYFLQAARVVRPLNDDERRRLSNPDRPFRLPPVARYVIHYADGQTAEIPVVLEREVADWLQEAPQALPGALVAWTGAVEGLADKQAVLYSLAAPNPRPEVEISAIDFALPLDDKGNVRADRAVPALLAVTLGTVLK
jgi:beta-galactosidase